MSILETLFGAKKGSSSANLAKQRLSVILHNGGNSDLSRKLEEKIKRAVIEFYEEEGMSEMLNLEDLEHNLKEEWMEFSIPLPESQK